MIPVQTYYYADVIVDATLLRINCVDAADQTAWVAMASTTPPQDAAERRETLRVALGWADDAPLDFSSAAPYREEQYDFWTQDGDVPPGEVPGEIRRRAYEDGLVRVWCRGSNP